MPLYVFECKPCDHVVEVLQKFGEVQPDCTKCHKQMKKKVALTSFTLKGAGWAKDNYGLSTN
jgi:putative FmdB family regulatory protein